MSQVNASETGSAPGEQAEEITPDSPKFDGISFRRPDGAVTEYQGAWGTDMVVVTKLVQREKAADPRDVMRDLPGFEWFKVTDGKVDVNKSVGKLALDDKTATTLLELCGDGQGGLDPELFKAAASQMRDSMQADADFNSALEGDGDFRAEAYHFFQTGPGYEDLNILPDISEAVGEAKQARMVPTEMTSVEAASSELENIATET